MFKLVIQDDEGKTTVVPLIRDEITIGRKEGNTIRLTERNVSRRHARILRNNGEVHIEDLGSYNGIRVNNARIAERVSLRVSDQVQIGDYKLFLKAEGVEQTDDGRTIPLDRDSNNHAPLDAIATPVPAPAPVAPPVAPIVRGTADTDPAARPIAPPVAAAPPIAPAPTGFGKLVVLSSNFAGKQFELTRPQMIVGRTDENDIVINHRSISRNHAKLVREAENNRYTISDLQSSNGVRVNGQDYGKVELRRGDVIDLGHVRLRFIEPGEDFVFERDAVITDVPESGSKRGMVFAVIAALLVLGAGVVIYSMRGDKAGRPGVVTPTPGESSGVLPPDPAGSGSEVAAAPAGEAPTVPEPTGSAVEPATAPVQPEAPTGSGKVDDRAQLAVCADLYIQKQWQSLDDCARQLESLGIKDKAKDYHAKARAETANEASDTKMRKELRDGRLKEAQQILRSIPKESVYFKQLDELFKRAETETAEDARRKAQALAANHDCAGLKRFVGLQLASSTDRVVAAASAVKCTPAAAEPKPPGGGSNVVAREPAATASAPVPKGCETVNVEDLQAQAQTQYNAGFAKTALGHMTKVLGCRQEVKYYRLAVLYACAAKDLTTAKLYFGKVPPSFQSSLEQKCQQEGLSLRDLPR